MYRVYIPTFKDYCKINKTKSLLGKQLCSMTNLISFFHRVARVYQLNCTAPITTRACFNEGHPIRWLIEIVCESTVYQVGTQIVITNRESPHCLYTDPLSDKDAENTSFSYCGHGSAYFTPYDNPVCVIKMIGEVYSVENQDSHAKMGVNGQCV